MTLRNVLKCLINTDKKNVSLVINVENKTYEQLTAEGLLCNYPLVSEFICQKLDMAIDNASARLEFDKDKYSAPIYHNHRYKRYRYYEVKVNK